MLKKLSCGILLLSTVSALSAAEIKSSYYNAKINEKDGIIKIYYSIAKGHQRYSTAPFLSLKMNTGTAQEFRGQMEASKEKYPRIYSFTGKESDGTSINGKVIFTR